MQYILDVLYVQMDNCWLENKNQFVIILLIEPVLVKKNIFKKVMRQFFDKQSNIVWFWRTN